MSSSSAPAAPSRRSSIASTRRSAPAAAGPAAAPPPPPPSGPPPLPLASAPGGPSAPGPPSPGGPSPPLRPLTLAATCAALERLRSLHAEHEACTLFAAPLLTHPRGGGKSDAATAAAAPGGGTAAAAAAATAAPPADLLHPRSLPGGIHDAWAVLSRAAHALDVLGAEVDKLLGGAGGRIEARTCPPPSPRVLQSRHP